MIVGAFVLMGLFVLKMIYSDGSQKMLNGTLGTAPVAATVHPVKNISDKELQAKIDLCVKQFGWTADQCKQAYDPKTEQARNQHLGSLPCRQLRNEREIYTDITGSSLPCRQLRKHC